MPSWIRRIIGRSSRGAPRRPRLAVRPSSPRFELLEGRLLLSALPADPVASGVAAVRASASKPTAMTVVMTSTLDAVGRVDSFLIPATVDWPEVRVELSLDAGGPEAVGILRVIDARGTTLATRGLGAAGSLVADVNVPTAPWADALSVVVTSRPSLTTGGGPGSYQIAISWDEIDAVNLSAGKPDIPPLTTSPTGISGIGTPPPTPPSPFRASFGLPAPMVPPMADAPAGNIVPPTPPPISLPPPPSAPVIHTPPPPVAPIPRIGGAAGVVSSLADRSQPTFVGPLPLGPSVADGGLFARGLGSIAATGIEAMTERSPAPAILPGQGWPGLPDAAEPEIIAEVAAMAALPPRGRPGSRWPTIIPAAGERADEGPASEGAAFLPPIAALAAPGPSTIAKSTPPAERRAAGRPRGIPVAFIGSAILLIGLAGPGLAWALTSHRARRRWEWTADRPAG